MTKTKTRNIIISILVLGILLFSAYGLDFSAFESFSLGNLRIVLKGISHPDWAYFYDGSGEDVLGLMITTIGIAFLGTLIGTIGAIPFTLIASSNLWKNLPVLPKVGKFILNILRSFPELVYAIIFVKVVGPGPFAGVLAIGIHHIGMLGKLYTEEMEAISEDSIEAMESVGANFTQTMFYARIPQLMPIYASLSLNHFEIALRSASTLGLVGAGGIGAPLIFAIQARGWEKVSIILISVIVTVFALDMLTGYIRKKLR